MTKTELIAEVSGATDIPPAAVRNAIRATLETITKELAGGGSIVFPGFGTFSCKHREARKGRNPNTGEAIDIAACNQVVFKAGRNLKEAVNPK